MLTEPRYEHDCNACIFLGAFGNADLWWHPRPLNTLSPQTPIARFSSNGPDYISGIDYASIQPALAEAVRLAVMGGHLDARFCAIRSKP